MMNCFFSNYLKKKFFIINKNIRQKKISFSCVDEITIFHNKMIDDRLIDL